MVLILMIFAHIVDDYYLQGILAKMKQKKWWDENAPKNTEALDEIDKQKIRPMYKYDYIMALMIHALSWAIMIILPILLASNWDPHWCVYIMLCVNWAIHSIVDDAKANKMKINLIADQCIHLAQILVTWAIWVVTAL